MAMLGWVIWGAALLGTVPQDGPPAGTLSLHPDNPHYFQWRGRPAILVTSGEHYGAVLNLDVDYATYLRTLHADGLNHTRLFVGTYREIPGSFGITDNTLAPHAGRYIAPWARSETPGYAAGGNKFDLKAWDEAYFRRLKAFLSEASKLGIVVEVNLWCPNYDEGLWKASPLHPSNNVNGVGNLPDGAPVPRDQVYTLLHEGLLSVQTAATRKIVRELQAFDNLYYEIANEPYFGGITLDWQHRIADVIVEAEKDYPRKHLISQNIANGRAKVVRPHPAVSIFNFHYCVPPDVVELNYGLNKVIGENETGFRGKDDVLYRTEGWEFMIAGGGLYNNLDYSFTTRVADGSFLDYQSPGGGSPALRRQLRALKEFLEGFDFVRMAPDRVTLRAAGDGLHARVLSEPGRQYAVYVHAPLGGRDFSVRWSGEVESPTTGECTLTATADGGVRVWVDGRSVIDDWVRPARRERSGEVVLEAGKRHSLVMEYRQAGDGASARLAWEGPGLKKQVIPKGRFRLADGSGPGLQAEYFDGRDLKAPVTTRIEERIEGNWSSRAPFPREPREKRADLILELPAGNYKAEWVRTHDGAVAEAEEVAHPGGPRSLRSPAFREDIALRLRAR